MACLVAPAEVSKGTGTDAKPFVLLLCFGWGGCLDMFEDCHVWSVLFLLKPEALWDTPFVCVGVLARHTLATPRLPCTRRHFQHLSTSVSQSICQSVCGLVTRCIGER